MATYSYYILHTSLQYRTISNGHGFILTQMTHDLVIPGLPEISSKKPESFISNINQKVEADPSPSTYAPYLLADPSGMTIDVELTLVTEDDKTIMNKIREKMSVLNTVCPIRLGSHGATLLKDCQNKKDTIICPAAL